MLSIFFEQGLSKYLFVFSITVAIVKQRSQFQKIHRKRKTIWNKMFINIKMHEM